MRRLFKTIILILVLSLSLGVVTFAEGTGGSGTGGGGSGTGSQTVINGASWQKSGFIYYIVDKNGNIVAEPQARVSFDKYPDSTECLSDGKPIPENVVSYMLKVKAIHEKRRLHSK